MSKGLVAEVCNESNGGYQKSAECKAVGDLGPESVLFIPKAEILNSPNPNKPGNIDQAPLLSITNESAEPQPCIGSIEFYAER